MPSKSAAVLQSRLHKPGDVFLVVEVADTSLAYDQETKVPTYARSGLSEVWVVDLIAEGVHVSRTPSAGQYLDMIHLHRGATLTPQAFPGVVLPVERIFDERPVSRHEHD